MSVETSYYDKDGMLHKFWENEEVLEYPEDTSMWSVENEYMVSAIVADLLDGSAVWYNYPISEKCKNEMVTKYKELEDRFPGYEENEYNNNNPLILNHYADVKNQMVYVKIRANKYQDVRYCYKYTINANDELDKIEYVSQEVVKDYTKEVEKRERIWLMIKDGDEIHNDNEYITVLWNYSDSINMTDFSLDRMGIVDELKEKKYRENPLPISYHIKYGVYMNKDYADYEKKEAEVYIYYEENHNFEKYLISFDYDDKYYLTKYEVLSREDITLEEYKKVSGTLKFGWELEK